MCLQDNKRTGERTFSNTNRPSPYTPTSKEISIRFVLTEGYRRRLSGSSPVKNGKFKHCESSLEAGVPSSLWALFQNLQTSKYSKTVRQTVSNLKATGVKAEKEGGEMSEVLTPQTLMRQIHQAGHFDRLAKKIEANVMTVKVKVEARVV